MIRQNRINFLELLYAASVQYAYNKFPREYCVEHGLPKLPESKLHMTPLAEDEQ